MEFALGTYEDDAIAPARNRGLANRAESTEIGA
jgi:hypothetical protein